MAKALDGSNEGADIGGERMGDLRFADDIASTRRTGKGNRHTEDADRSRKVEQKMGMKINIKKTECQFLGEGNKKFRLEVEGQELEQTENFVYLEKRRKGELGWRGELGRRWGRCGTPRN